MKSGSRTLGIAFSDSTDQSRIAGAVVRVDRTTDGFVFGECSIGGLDATRSLISLCDRLDREDVQRVMTAGIAPAWFNLIDLVQLRQAINRPIIAVSFEDSAGLETVLQREFDGDELSSRMGIYNRLPERDRIQLAGREFFIRAVGLDREDAFHVVRSHVEDSRPEPLRVARLAARAYSEVA